MHMEGISHPSGDPRTPERKQPKRFRNGSSPFRAISPSDFNTAAIWEWKSGGGKWFTYSPAKAELLENSLCVTDRVTLPGPIPFEIDLRRFIQLNPRSGRERAVRRRVAPEIPFPRVPKSLEINPSYDGKTVFLNKLAGSQVGIYTEVSFGEIVDRSEYIESVFLTSYGTDIEWVLKYLRAGTPITLIDQPPSGDHDTSMFPLGNLWPRFQLIHPRFEKGGLFQSGTMHCKLIMIKYQSGLLRLCISSANLVEFDWTGITQVVWVVDVDPSKQRNSIDSGSTSFGQDLLEFVERLVGENTLDTDWISILSEYKENVSLQVPGNVHLVASVPGSHSKQNLHKYGQLRLRKLLEGYPDQQSVIFQMSSLGQLQNPFMESFMKSLRTTPDLFHIVWPEYVRAMRMPGRDHVMLASKNLPGALKYMRPLEPLCGRTHALNHSKLIYGSSDFAYIGSHNLSMSAWGRLVNEETALQIASYELGVLITDVKARNVSLTFPFEMNMIGSPIVRAWTFDAFLNEVKSDRENGLSQFLSLNEGNTVGLYFDDKSNSVVTDYVEKTICTNIPVFCCDMSGDSKDPTDYGHHLTAFYGIEQLPCFLLQTSERKEMQKLCGMEILQAEIPPDEQCENVSFAEQFMKDHGITLLCLDVDGTIVESNTSSVLLPCFVKFLSKLDPAVVKIALVTNQGGVGLRHWMRAGSFGDPSSLPSQEEVEARILSIREKISSIFSGQLACFMAFRYQSKGDASAGKAPRWGPVPFSGKEDVRWKQEWRKPNPGMLLEAMKWAGLSIFNKSCSLMVGDMDSDEGAARNAGIKFQRAPEFFMRRCSS